MLTEWVPKVQPGAEVYATHVWQFGTPNGVGVRYTKTLLQQKKIQIAWKEGDYRLDSQRRKHHSGTTVPLRFPTFGVKSDGLVVHRGTNQRFLKPYRTVDIKEQDTYEALERRGEEDACSAYQMLAGRFPCVSIPLGSSAAVECIKTNYDYVNSFDTIYLSFDNDEPGKKAIEGVANLFDFGKVRVIHLPQEAKDANDVGGY